MNYLIYAAYGSNLLKERFMVYIKGGFYEGRQYQGSKDKTEPEDFGWIRVPHRLYFAKRSPRWDNKGVAFLSTEIETDPKYFAIVRLWKVSQEQFEDIKKQEGSWYYKIFNLGQRDGLEIRTITGSYIEEINEPSKRYLDVIRRGLKETTKWTAEEIDEYLQRFQ